MQVRGCRPGGCRLGGVLLSLAQLGDGGGQGDELGHEREGHQRVVACEIPASAIIRAVHRSWSPS